jgi:CRP-like cAMP-binding protein
MERKEKQEFLSKIGIFSKCKGGDLKALAKTCKEMEFSQGEVICKQGEKGSALFIIIFGKADVLKEKPDGTSVKIADLKEGDVIGELAVIDGEERSATVVATEKTLCLVITSWDLIATLKDRPLMALDILKMVIARYRSLADKIKNGRYD